MLACNNQNVELWKNYLKIGGTGSQFSGVSIKLDILVNNFLSAIAIIFKKLYTNYNINGDVNLSNFLDRIHIAFFIFSIFLGDEQEACRKYRQSSCFAVCRQTALYTAVSHFIAKQLKIKK